MNTIFSTIRKKKIFRALSAFLAINLMIQIFSPTVALALTSGPSQPEVQSFEPAGTSDMVDLFTGDFNYNIPLFDLPGPNGSYPFNLAYHSGINMDQEASWTGLGWNINPGAINRDKRGLPDDFNGDPISTYLSIKDNETYGVSVSPGFELWGGDANSSTSTGNLNVGMTIYNNSYKGIGYSLEPSFKYTTNEASVGVGLSLDSQAGVGIDADITLGSNLRATQKDKQYGGSLGVGFNSQRGLNLAVSGFASNSSKVKKSTSYGGGGGSSYTFAEKAFTPAFSSQMDGKNLRVSVKFGIDGLGAFSELTLGGFYNTEGIKEPNHTYYGYGYNYLEASGGPDAMMDFNREKDGIVRKETPNLPAPILTHDTYMALGQGFLGSYRAHRSDVGHLHDPYVESTISGGSVGVELGPGGPFHLGVAASFSQTKLTSGDWDENNEWVNGSTVNYIYGNKEGVNIHNYEKLYYKMKGEPTSFDTDELNFIGGEKAIRASLERQGSFVNAYYNPIGGLLVPSSGPEQSVTTNLRTKEERINRNTSIQPITNDLLIESNELLNEYQLKYYTTALLDNGFYDAGAYENYNRSALPGHHTAGFTCVNSSGLRYVYALPAYNTSEKEIAFTLTPSKYTSVTLDENTNFIPQVSSTDNQSDNTTDRFKSVTETPDYTHSHLLTSVLGADYVDADATPGPSDGDYGYWVKFTYVRTTDDYQWRSPYDGASYLRGQNFKASDDKGIFAYGKKEIWYLATAETKSHIAIFKLSERHDGLEAKGEYYSDGHTREKLHKLNELSLYSKPEYAASEAPTPLKTVHFEYDYSLCPNVPNNDALESGSTQVNYKKGKLTLKKVWFTYQNNTRGELSPYTFDYNESDTYENPAYNADCYDRWGGYKDATDFYRTRNLPYVTQFDPAQVQSSDNKEDFKERTDRNAAVWNLKTIGLPTGGSIDVTYESDDYAYVQHRQAAQMFNILRMSDAGEVDKVYSLGSGWDHTDDDLRRVYFKLESPIPVSGGTDDENKLYNDYLSGLVQADGHLQMYFRLKSKLRDDIYETVSGYCDLENDNTDDFGFDTGADAVIDGVNSHTIGYITLKLMSGNNSALPGSGTIEYHPFAVAAWQHMRTNAPELLTAFGSLSSAASGSSDMDKAVKVKSLLSTIPAAIQTFTGYRRYAFNHGWGRKLDLDKSFIRLATPDKSKFGGGLRVKRITYTDNWSASSTSESSNSYGQVYTYTTTEGTGADAVAISSGVAQYEPLTGGDEIALRHAKNFMQTIPLFTDNNLFFEYPINESYYPGPGVGYSKVSVQSIASYRTNVDNTSPEAISDKSIPTTGLVEYRFYTAHDYPVITDETDNQMRKFDLYIPIPLIGQITANKLYGTQGYAITLNDMHGKLKSVTNYSKNINGEINPVPVSAVEYKYKTIKKQFDGQEVNVLDNTVPAIVNEYVDRDSGSSTYKKMLCQKKNVILGEEYDFFIDSRQSHILSTQGGLELNIEFATPFPIPVPWPSFASTTKNLKTLVTNKVIQKSGILDTTIATDGQSVVKTYNKLFDAQTGAPLLTVVNNNFDKPVYNYSNPAYWKYDGMGAAALNHDYTFHAKVNSVNTTNNTFGIYNTATYPVNKNTSVSPTPYPIDKDDFYNTIMEGDELIIQPICPSCTTKYTATLTTKSAYYDVSCGKVYTLLFHSASGADMLTADDEVKFTIVRSGRRNMLNTNIGSIAGLKDPTEDTNRGLHTTSDPMPAVAAEFALLFNTLLEDDCDMNGRFRLPMMTIDFSDGGYFGSNARELFPTLTSFLKSITISGRPVTECHEDYINQIYLGERQYFYEQYMTYNYVNEAGSCETGECCLGLYGYCPDPEDCTLMPIGTSHFFVNETGVLELERGTDVVWDNEQLLVGCFSIPGNYTYIEDVVSSSSVIYRQFFDYDSWATLACGTAPSGGPDQTNLYSLGKKGIWKPYMNYYYKDERVNQQLSTDVNIDHDGVYKGNNIVPGVNEFYLFPFKPAADQPVHPKWMPNSLVAMYDQNSNAVETQDIVKINSSVVYGYDGQLPVIQGNNASRGELFYESFDDPSSVNYSMSIEPVAHTGKYSVNTTGNSDYVLSGLKLKGNNKSYTISLWVNSGVGHAATYTANTDLGIKLAFYDETNTLISTTALLQPSGKVIEGWQRIEGTFIIPGTVPANTITTKINLRTGTDSYYFDDIRIFPTLSNVSTSVYNSMNFRIAAVLDANNYATFYSYDEEGKLFLVRKETINGIKTIKEERAHIIE